MHEKLLALGVPHLYVERPDGHVGHHMDREALRDQTSLACGDICELVFYFPQLEGAANPRHQAVCVIYAAARPSENSPSCGKLTGKTSSSQYPASSMLKRRA